MSFQDPSSMLVASMLIEGPFGALIMELFLVLAILMATSGLWRIGARKLALTEILLVLAMVAYIANALRLSVANSVSPMFFFLLIIVAVLIPLYAAALCWLKGFRRTAMAAIAFVILWLGAFALRKAFPIFISGPS